jgi:hypothetical protein
MVNGTLIPMLGQMAVPARPEHQRHHQPQKKQTPVRIRHRSHNREHDRSPSFSAYQRNQPATLIAAIASEARRAFLAGARRTSSPPHPCRVILSEALFSGAEGPASAPRILAPHEPQRRTNELTTVN